MIRSAKIPEIPDILRLTRACAKMMEKKGIYQWNEHYPNSAFFERDIQREELFVMEIEGQLIGSIVISTFMDEEYLPVEWLTPNRNNIYIHRLAVHPDRQGKGYAQRLMAFAEDRAKERGAVSIRLDTFSQNPRNQRFYEARGYQKLGDIFFPEQSGHPFHCYELVL